MPKPKVFVTRRIPAAGLDKIRAACDVEVWPEPTPPPRAVLLDRAAEAEGIVSLLTDAMDVPLMEAAPHLRVISNFAVGFDNIDVPAATERGIAVGNTPEVLTDATADMAFCLLISAGRRLVEAAEYVKEGHWETWEPLGHIGADLMGKTLGIVGMGRIGSALAQRCRGGWGMNILYHDVASNPDAETNLGARKVDFDTLLTESDFISVHTVLNKETHGLFNAAAFRRMKPTAVFVNTARGRIHVHGDLVAALRDGEIFAAGLDVTHPEPLPPEDPLLLLPNAIVAPHIASATRQSRDAMSEIAAANLLAGLQGEPLQAWLNPEVESTRRR